MPQMIGCFSRHILIENVAAKLNYSVEYISARALSGYAISAEFYLRTSYSALAITGYLPWVVWNMDTSADNMLKQVLRRQIYSVYMYCTESLEREGFSFFFWILPFDNWTWLFLGISILTITLVVHGNWFPVFAILMRQNCGILDGRKLLMIFIIAAIIFTYGYEGIVSSFLTVQPPVKVYETLKGLLSANYTMRAPTDGILDEYKEIFKRGNITGSVGVKIYDVYLER